MNFRFTSSVAIIVAIVSMSNPAFSELRVSRLDDKGRVAWVQIVGLITRADAKMFTNLARVLRPEFDTLIVELNSPGGNVLAALEIGEVIRREWLWTTVPDEPGTECASACVFIFAAGARRIAGDDSKVVIHRPYFDDQLFAGLDRHQAKAKYDLMAGRVRSYLASMGISDQLFQEMMKISSNNARLLTYKEMEQFSLVGDDPGYDEWVRAKSVAKHGEENVKAHDAWLDRLHDFVASCKSLGRSALDCNSEFERRHPNPLRSK